MGFMDQWMDIAITILSSFPHTHGMRWWKPDISFLCTFVPLRRNPEVITPVKKQLASSCLGFRIILYCKRKEKEKPWADHVHEFLSCQKSLSSEWESITFKQGASARNCPFHLVLMALGLQTASYLSFLPFFGSQEFKSHKRSKAWNVYSDTMNKIETAMIIMERANLENDVVRDSSCWHKKHSVWHLEEQVSWQVGR